MYIQPSIHWAILNLIPVWPLDGGRFVHSLMQLRGGTIVMTLMVGVVVSALVALFAFQNELSFLGFMFLILGWNNFQAVQQLQGSR
jgi:Zn-dependent protease